MKLAACRTFALSLPETTEEPHFDFTSFRVKGKIFATAPPGGEFLHVFVPDAQRDQTLAMFPAFAEKLTWGAKVVGVRLQLAKADAAAVKQLLKSAWTHKAPKRLAAAAQ